MDKIENNTDSFDAESTLVPGSELTAARKDIEQTRQSMGETLEEIREKLNPQLLMDQAKETVLEVTSSVTDKAKSTLHEVADDMKNSVHTMVTDVSDHAKESAKDAVSGAVDEVKGAVGAVIDSTKKAGASMMDTAKNNPMSTMVLFGAGWYLLSRRKPSAMPSNEMGSVLDAAMHNPIPAALVIGTALHLYHHHNQPGESLDNKASEVVDKASEVVKGAKGTLTNAVATVKDTLDTAASSVKEVAGKASDVAGSVGERVKQAETSLMSTMNTNPLMIGICALGIGATIALLLPDTEPENKLMGQTRDTLMDTAHESAGQLIDKIHLVSSKVIDSASETVNAETKVLNPAV